MGTSTVASIFTNVIATANDTYAIVLPLIFSFAVVILIIFILWKWFKRGAKGK